MSVKFLDLLPETSQLTLRLKNLYIYIYNLNGLFIIAMILKSEWWHLTIFYDNRQELERINMSNIRSYVWCISFCFAPTNIKLIFFIFINHIHYYHPLKFASLSFLGKNRFSIVWQLSLKGWFLVNVIIMLLICLENAIGLSNVSFPWVQEFS